MYGWAISQELPVNYFNWVEETSQFNEDLTEIYNEDSDRGYFIKTDVQYPKNVRKLHNDLAFWPEKMKIEKIEKLVANLYDKQEYVIHIRNLKQALNHGLVFKKCLESLRIHWRFLMFINASKKMYEVMLFDM